MSNVIINTSDMVKLIEFVKNICGNDLDSKKEILKDKIITFCKNNNFDDVNLMMNKVLSNRSLRQELINELTINETYFFREVRQLQAVIDYVNMLDSNLATILCLPCSSGEEVYTLGMLSKMVGIEKHRLKILGLDINSNVIEKSKLGEYTAKSLQNTPKDKIETFFEKKDDKFKVKKTLMPMIDFKVANFFDDSIFSLGVFDVIISRNMLIYFDEYHRAVGLERFYRLLKPEGRLYVGTADIIPSSELFNKNIDLSATYYQKK